MSFLGSPGPANMDGSTVSSLSLCVYDKVKCLLIIIFSLFSLLDWSSLHRLHAFATTVANKVKNDYIFSVQQFANKGTFVMFICLFFPQEY